MASNGVVGGVLSFKCNGKKYDARGEFKYNMGLPKREAVVGDDGPHGFTEKPQSPYISGVVTDSKNLNIPELVTLKDATVTLALRNGKTLVLYDAFFSSEGEVEVAEGKVTVRFDGSEMGEVK